MTDYFLMTALDPNVMKRTAEKLGATLLAKQTTDFVELGRNYMGASVYVFEPTQFREVVESAMKRGATSVGVDNPDFHFFEDYIGIVRKFESDKLSGKRKAVIAAHANGTGVYVIRESQVIESS